LLCHGLAISLLLLAAPAGAQTTMTPTTNGQNGTAGLGVTKADFTLAFMEKKDDQWVFMNKTTFDTYFNRARCECDTEVQVRVTLAAPARRRLSGKTGDVKLRAGDNTCVCTGAACTNIRCTNLGPPQPLVGLVNNSLEFRFKVRDLFAAGRSADDTSPVCDVEQKQDVWLWIDSNDSGTDPDITDVTMQVELDGRAPPAPTGLNATGGNDALQVSWDAIGHIADFQGYQVLCARGGEYPPFPNHFTPRYTNVAACPAAGTSSGTDGGVDAGTDGGTTTTTGALMKELSTNVQAVEAMRGPAPPPLAARNPDFLCSDLLSTQTGTRLFRLQSGIPYAVGVVSIDKRGNASPLTEVVVQTPTATVDFYTGYRDVGGAAEGGFCSLGSGQAGTMVPWALGSIAGLAMMGLSARRRRRGGRQ
jgi:hypothetical protein